YREPFGCTTAVQEPAAVGLDRLEGEDAPAGVEERQQGAAVVGADVDHAPRLEVLGEQPEDVDLGGLQPGHGVYRTHHDLPVEKLRAAGSMPTAPGAGARDLSVVGRPSRAVGPPPDGSGEPSYDRTTARRTLDYGGPARRAPAPCFRDSRRSRAPR